MRARQQDRIERFGQIVFGPQLDTADHAADLVESRQHDDRNVAQARIRLQLFQYLIAVHLRHHDIEQNKVERIRLDHLQPEPPVFRNGGFMAIRLQQESTAYPGSSRCRQRRARNWIG